MILCQNCGACLFCAAVRKKVVLSNLLGKIYKIKIMLSVRLLKNNGIAVCSMEKYFDIIHNFMK